MPAAALPSPHRRHEPEKGLWHKILRENLKRLIDEARDPDDPRSGIPLFVERELTEVLGCGLLSEGLIRLACPDCQREKLVALSCQARAACPSCGARRMAETAAHLVDRVLPENVPVRQWVITAPVELRLLLLSDSTFMSAFIRIAVTTIFRHLRARARAVGLEEPQCGAVTFIQRFSASLGVFPHLHLIALDGVFTKSALDQPPVFTPLAPPTERDEYLVSAAICERLEALLRRRGLVDPEPTGREPTPLERWFARAVEERARLSLVDDDGHVTPGRGPLPRSTSTGEVAGLSVHARVTVRGDDKAGRERLARYCARPPFSARQLAELPDGRIAFELSTPRRTGETHLVLEPIRLLRRVAWLIPPPRSHVIRYAGVLAPAAKLRREIVPEPVVVLSLRGQPAAVAPSQAPSPSRIEWARLLRRIYDVDALLCECGGRFRPIAAVLDPRVARKIVQHIDRAAEPQLRAARAPPDG